MMKQIVNKIFLISVLLFLVALALMILREMNILHFSRPENMWIPTLIFVCIAIVSNTVRKKLKARELNDSDSFD